MRSILMALLLLVTAIVLYTAIAEGDSGTLAVLEQSGGAMSDSIRRLDP
jgi:hypothetical protein